MPGRATVRVARVLGVRQLAQAVAVVVAVCRPRTARAPWSTDSMR